MELWVFHLLAIANLSQLSPVVGILTDPGPLCSGQTVTLTCDISGGTELVWNYNGAVVASIDLILTNFPSADPVLASGVEFSVSLLSTSPDLASQIMFVASEEMRGRILACGGRDGSGGRVEITITLQVQTPIGPPSDVRQSNSLPIQYGIEQSNVTIEWTPPPNGGNDVMYTIGITPPPISGAMSVSSTQTTITVNYSISYTVTVGVNTTCNGVQEATGTINIAGCLRPPVPMDGSIIPFPATNEGAEIVYHCDPGFQPQSNVTAMCASNGLWTPDPALLQCVVDCGAPVIPSNVNVSDTSNTTEGATVTFQCEEGLIPSHLTITCTRNGNVGQWIPDPASIQCRPNITSSEPATTSTDVDGSTAAPSATSISTRSASNGTAPAIGTGVIVGVVVIFVALIVAAVVAMVIIIIMCRRHRSTGKKTVSKNGLELQEAPIMEYSTLSSRGYEDSTTKDDYSTVRHTAQDLTKSPDRPPFSAEYSLLNTDKPTGPTSGQQENGGGGLVYADIGAPKPKKSTPQSMPTPDDRVVYSAIDTKATAKHQKKQGLNADASLDLNMMLIQVRVVIPSWLAFGEALGVPEEYLKQIQEMALENYDKLVEVLDYWFRAFPKETPPTWRAVAMALQNVGFEELAAEILKVYTTGQLPISVSEEVPREAYGGESLPPPPLPPKVEESGDVSASLPPKPGPRVGSLKNVPPRPPKTNMSAPPRPPKSATLEPAAPKRPPKPGHQ